MKIYIINTILFFINYIAFKVLKNILEINNTNSKYTIKIKTKYNLSCKEVLRALVYDESINLCNIDVIKK